MKERGEMEQVLEGVIAHRSFWLNRRNLSTRVGIGWAVESSGLKTSEAGGGVPGRERWRERESFPYYITIVPCMCHIEHSPCYYAFVYLHLNYLQKYRKV